MTNQQEPSYYPLPYALGITCPNKSCSRGVGDYCHNPLATFYTFTDKNEKYHFFHEPRNILASKALATHPAYYHLKSQELDSGEYLVAKYYSVSNELVGVDTKDKYPRDHYTFHGFLDPDIKRDRTVKIANVRPGHNTAGLDLTKKYSPHQDPNLDFNF